MMPVTNWYIGSSKFRNPKEPITSFKRSLLTLHERGAGISEIGIYSVQGPEGLKSLPFNASSKCPDKSEHEGEPTKYCQCGFYSYTDLSKAYAHLAKHESPGTVILKTVASGKMIMYTDGVRAGRQRVVEVMVDKCYDSDCGQYADRMCITDKDRRLLAGVCAKHAGRRYGKLYSFAAVESKINNTLTNGEPEITVSSFNSKVKPWNGEFDFFKREDAVKTTIGFIALGAASAAAVYLSEK